MAIIFTHIRSPSNIQYQTLVLIVIPIMMNNPIIILISIIFISPFILIRVLFPQRNSSFLTNIFKYIASRILFYSFSSSSTNIYDCGGRIIGLLFLFKHSACSIFMSLQPLIHFTREQGLKNSLNSFGLS